MPHREESLAQTQAQGRRRQVEFALRRFRATVPTQHLAVDPLDDLANHPSLSRGGVMNVRRYLDDPTRFLLLCGPTGTGKTTVAVAVASEWIRRTGMGAHFVTAPMMLMNLSFGHGGRSASDVLSEYVNAPMLIIDDLGAGNDGLTAHQEKMMWALIDARWSHERPTIITTNMALHSNRDGQGLAELVGEACWDRISGTSMTVVDFDGESLRGLTG